MHIKRLSSGIIIVNLFIKDKEFISNKNFRQLLRMVYICQGYVPLTLDVMRVAFKVPLAFHTPL